LSYRGIKFVYDEPAMIAKAGGTDYLVIADLHIGMELGLSKKGIHLYNATDRIADRIKKIMKDFKLKRIIMLGDIKESILYPDAAEINLLKNFFRELAGFETTIIAGNHDAHLAEIIDHETKKELIIGSFGFIHGNRIPSGEMMRVSYLISAHDHIAVRKIDRNGAVYEQKEWTIYKASKKDDRIINKNIKLISMPAFNDLIIGTSVDSGTTHNPLLSNKLFDSRSLELYNLLGQKM